MIFHILLVIHHCKSHTQLLLPPTAFLSLTRDSRPLRESYTGPFVCVEYHKFFITSRNAALHYAKAP